MAINAFKRYEKKFILDPGQYEAVLPALMEHMQPDPNCRDGMEYTINNIYYDTDDSRIIRHSLSKPYYKEKLRLRCYGGPAGLDSQVFLELKKKIGGIVNKRRAELTLDQALQFIGHGSYPGNPDYMQSQVLREIGFFLQSYDVKPVAYISYKRSALFGTNDRDLRITIDSDIITRRDQLSLSIPRFGTCLLPPGHRLMEVKVACSLPLWLAHLLAENQVFPASYSKYGREYLNYRSENVNRHSLMKAV